MEPTVHPVVLLCTNSTNLAKMELSNQSTVRRTKHGCRRTKKTANESAVGDGGEDRRSIVTLRVKRERILRWRHSFSFCVSVCVCVGTATDSTHTRAFLHTQTCIHTNTQTRVHKGTAAKQTSAPQPTREQQRTGGAKEQTQSTNNRETIQVIPVRSNTVKYQTEC